MLRAMLALCAWLIAGNGFAIPAIAQPTSQVTQDTRVIGASDLQEDVALLRLALEQLHPGLYRYNTKTQMDCAFAQLARAFSQEQTLQQAYLTLSAFCAKIRCGHTYPNFFNQSKTVRMALFERPDKLPFFFRWLDHKMIVTRDFTDAQVLPLGTEILSINGVAAPDILRRLLPYVRGDGGNDTKRIELLQVQGEDTYDAMDVYFPMVFPVLADGFTLVTRRNRGKRERLTVRALSFAQRQASVTADLSGDSPLFQIHYLDDQVALLSMPTWEMYNSTWDWQTWLNRTLDEIIAKKCTTLVIDLRGNEGAMMSAQRCWHDSLVIRSGSRSSFRWFVFNNSQRP